MLITKDQFIMVEELMVVIEPEVILTLSAFQLIPLVFFFLILPPIFFALLLLFLLLFFAFSIFPF
jgi:hypothetical protein